MGVDSDCCCGIYAAHGRRQEKVIGLGEYPGYRCYDANRPSWLPYWIDTFSESNCKYKPTEIAGNVWACATGDPTCATPPPGQDPTKSGAGIDPSLYPRCNQFQTLNPDTGQCEVNVTSPGLLIVAAVALFVVLMAAKI